MPSGFRILPDNLDIRTSMKRYILIPAILLLAVARPALACEFCQCLLGLNPLYSSSNTLALHLVHQRWTYPQGGDPGTPHSKRASGGASFSPSLMHQDHGDGDLSRSETRRTLELAYRHHITPDLLAVAIVPYVMSTETGQHTAEAEGIGDPMLLGYYVLRGEAVAGVPATLLLGGGVTVPVGRYRSADGLPGNPHLMPGSGSVDLLLNTTATMQAGGWTFGADLFGRLATPNRFDTRLAPSGTFSLSVNRDLLRDNEDEIAVVGIAGARGEISGDDRIEGVIDAGSARRVAFGMLGGQVVAGSWKLDFSLLVPVARAGESAVHREDPRFVVGGRLEL